MVVELTSTDHFGLSPDKQSRVGIVCCVMYIGDDFQMTYVHIFCNVLLIWAAAYYLYVLCQLGQIDFRLFSKATKVVNSLIDNRDKALGDF